jgi:hypothetical protein
MIYVNVDGKWHAQVEDSASRAASTACGKDIPFAAEWSGVGPMGTDPLCTKCFPKKAA